MPRTSLPPSTPDAPLRRVSGERLHQPRPGPRDSRAHRPRRTADRPGDVVVGEALDVAEPDAGPLLLWQRGHCARHLVGEYAAQELLLEVADRRIDELRLLRDQL